MSSIRYNILSLIQSHQENSKLLIFYLICLNPLNLKFKGAPARESRTGTRLVSPARDREKKKKKYPQQN